MHTLKHLMTHNKEVPGCQSVQARARTEVKFAEISKMSSNEGPIMDD